MKRALLLLFVVVSTAYSQSTHVTIDSVANYRSWGWNAAVMQNGLITVATMPAIGGRIMVCDLGSRPSVFVNSAETGHTYTPSQSAPWHNIGGFKSWPSPQSAWNAGGWPPPPTLDYGAYTMVIDSSTKAFDSVSVTVTSPVEQWFAPGLRFARKATAYSGTSRLRMEMSVVNTGSTTVHWGLWGITQTIVHHNGQSDYQNYWCYFPLNPNSHYGPTGVSPQGPSSAWKGEVSPGIYGVQFSPDNQKIFADPDKGWIAYASLADSTVFIRTFDVFPDSTYPDNQARITVYVSASNPTYFEMETKGPVATLAGSGGTASFTENWWAARMRGPVVDANTVGAIAQKLSLNASTHHLTGIAGVFYEGTAQAACVDSTGAVLGSGTAHAVTPLQEFMVDDSLSVPSGTSRIELRLFNATDSLVGILDTLMLAGVTAVAPQQFVRADAFRLDEAYPNPCNPSTCIGYTIASSKEKVAGRGGMVDVRLVVYDLLGREVAVLVDGYQKRGEHQVVFTGKDLASGVYFYRLMAEGQTLTKRFVILK